MIIGGSGVGKSVTLKCALGLMKPDAGKVLVDGADVTRMPQEIRARVMRKFGMLFQGGALFDSLTVWENIAFRLIYADKVARKEARERAIETMRKVRLAPEFADVRPIELSGGMQKRAGLARAIIAKPDIIFFDEPTTGLDPITADAINDLIVEMVKELGCAAVSITHDMASARKIADEIAMLYDGKIVWRGPASALDDQRQRDGRSVRRRPRRRADPGCGVSDADGRRRARRTILAMSRSYGWSPRQCALNLDRARSPGGARSRLSSRAAPRAASGGSKATSTTARNCCSTRTRATDMIELFIDDTNWVCAEVFMGEDLSSAPGSKTPTKKKSSGPMAATASRMRKATRPAAFPSAAPGCKSVAPNFQARQMTGPAILTLKILTISRAVLAHRPALDCGRKPDPNRASR